MASDWLTALHSANFPDSLKQKINRLEPVNLPRFPSFSLPNPWYLLWQIVRLSTLANCNWENIANYNKLHISKHFVSFRQIEYIKDYYRSLISVELWLGSVKQKHLIYNINWRLPPHNFFYQTIWKNVFTHNLFSFLLLFVAFFLSVIFPFFIFLFIKDRNETEAAVHVSCYSCHDATFANLLSYELTFLAFIIYLNISGTLFWFYGFVFLTLVKKPFLLTYF